MSAWQGWDGEDVIIRNDKRTGAWMIIAIHSTALGPPAGGTRLHRYATFDEALADAFRLSEHMSYKFALAGLPRGGAKAVIALSTPLPAAEREGLFRRYGEWIRNHAFTTATDLGTTAADMDVVNAAAPGFAAADSSDDSDSATATARGVFAAMSAGALHVFGSRSLQDRHVLVQGAGKVGGELIRFLENGGASIAFNDRDPETIANLTARGLKFVTDGGVFDHPCDIFAPCAVGGVLNHETIPRLRCRLIAGAANNQLRDDGDADLLDARGITCVPDFVANAGGAIAIVGRRVLNWTVRETDARVDAIGDLVTRILSQAGQNAASPFRVAIAMAMERLALPTSG